jgi:hypothetical protein
LGKVSVVPPGFLLAFGHFIGEHGSHTATGHHSYTIFPRVLPLVTQPSARLEAELTLPPFA